MKIAVISPNKNHLQDMGRVLEAQAHTVTLLEGGKSRMRAIAEQEQPDLMLVDGMCCDPNELIQVEYVTTHHPKIAVILLCSTQTPEFLINSMRLGVREVLPSPVTPDALNAAVSRIAAKFSGAHIKSPGKVLAFMPCKGGSGATFLATNLGYQLAETRSVLLMDLNLQFGDALSFVHDGKPASSLADVAHDISRLDASFLAASTVKIAANYSILPAPEDASKAMEIKPEHVEAILNLAITQYDFVLLDLSRTLDTLTIKALDRSYRIFPVLQAGLPSLRNASKLLAIFKSLGYPPDKTEWIVNRFEKTGDISLDSIQRALDTVNLRTVPNSYKEVNTSINQGHALAARNRANAVSKSLAEFAFSFSPRPDESRSFIDRLLRRA
ncbi:MAG: AAA family ATPase [Pseudomonadota bacterium]|nr:AAA family ATPase [Pseudomonadota bacterium]